MIFFIIGLFAFTYSSPSLADGDITELSTICSNIPRLHNNPAEYTAGVDIHGKAVTPADLYDGTANHEPLIIPIELDLARRFNLELPIGIELKPEVSNMKIYEDGRVVFNNQDITSKVMDACNNPANSIAESPNTDRHKAADAVVSDGKIGSKIPDE